MRSIVGFLSNLLCLISLDPRFRIGLQRMAEGIYDRFIMLLLVLSFCISWTSYTLPSRLYGIVEPGCMRYRVCRCKSGMPNMTVEIRGIQAYMTIRNTPPPSPLTDRNNDL